MVKAMSESTKIQLWKHQILAIQKSEGMDHYGLFFEPGVGKTATTIHMLRQRMNAHKKLLPVLVLCPPVVIENWKQEFLMHSKIPDSRIHCLTGPGEKRFKTLQANPGEIFITNYEALLMEPVFKELVKLLSLPHAALVCDEIHRCKDTTAKRTKRTIQLADIAHYRFGLTGTPVLNSLMDVFSQMRIIDRGASLGNNFFSFRAKYFYDKNRGMSREKYFPDWRPLPHAEKEIRHSLERNGMYASKSDCLDLPPLVKKVIHVELSPEQKRLYKEMKKDLIATISDDGGTHVSIAELAITKALRLQQIVSGHLRVEQNDGEARTITIRDNPRKTALKELLSDITVCSKVLVWSVFKDNYEDIRDVCESLRIRFVEVHGEVFDKKSAVDSFNNDPEVRVLIGHPGSGGIGINLTSSNVSIYYSRNFSLEQRLQSEARNYRGGSEIHQSITLIDLVAKDTIDELVLKSLESKQELSNRILKEHMSEL